MKYSRFLDTLQKNRYYIFSLRDLLYLFPGASKKTIQNQLTEWLKKGYIIRLKKGVYEFLQRGSQAGDIPDLYVANKLYEPSYVSLETALSIYSIIPDIAAGVTSVTTKPTRTFKNKYGAFFYRSCTPKAFVGYKLMTYDGFKVHIADKEKALVDFIYYRLRSGFSLDFAEERFNKKVLKEISWRKIFYYTKFFNKKTTKMLKQFQEYLKC